MAQSTKSLSLVAANNEYASHANAAALEVTGDFTWESWLKPTSLSVLQFVLSFGGGDETEANNILYQIIINTNGSIRFDHEYSTGTNETYTTTATGVVVAGEWHHFAIIRDTTANTMTFYKDASAVESAHSYTNEATGGTTSSLYIGTNDNTSTANDYGGLYHDTRFWSEARSGANISTYYQTDLTGSETNLFAYYKWQDDLTDETSNALDLTDNNTVGYSTDIPDWGSTHQRGPTGGVAFYGGAAFY